MRLWRVPTLPTKRSPRGVCACNHCHYTRTLWLSIGAPRQWFHGLPSWGGKFLPVLYLPLLVPQKRMFSAAGNVKTKKRARLTCNHLEELMYLHKVWLKMREWTAINKAHLVWWLHVSHTRAHTHKHKHTHSYTKNPLGRISCFFAVTNNKYQKRKRVHVADSLSLLYKYMNNSTWSSVYLYTSTPTHTHVWFPSLLSFE